jgi:peroxiredoxin
MKLPGYLWSSFLILLLASCTPTPNNVALNLNQENILKDFKTWWTYNYRNINLSKDYLSLDTSSKFISKEAFLKLLSTGKYVSFRVNSANSSLKYQLFKLPPNTNWDIRAVAKQCGEGGYQKYLMEGREIPDFDYRDVNGKVYNKANTNWKIVVLKCWFINCTVCVQEMPALNAFIKEFKDRDDVLFISLAFDPETKLKSFLAKTKFDYAVIHSSQKYIQEKIGVHEYPTQIIINRNGLITKVVNDYHDMIFSLRKELAK